VGILGLAQPLALSAPLTNAQLPFPLFINGNELSQGVSGADALTYRLRDPGFSGPQTFDFTIHDHTLAVVPWIAKQQQVVWYDSVKSTYLFSGFIKNLAYRTVGPWVDIAVTCSHISEALDFARPFTTWDSGIRGPSDRSMIGSLLGYAAPHGNLGSGGYIQVLNASMPASLPNDRTTLRNAIDQVLAATGVQGAVAYVDNLGFLHTMAIGDIGAPYNISDTPNYTTTIPAALTVMDQGAFDVDALYIYGGTTAGSGAIYTWQATAGSRPRSPLRWAMLDAPQAVDEATKLQAATVEFQRRQNALAVTLVVSGDSVHGGFDGWAKGQLISITNGPLGWSGKQLTISAVDMDVISGNGVRRYTITAGSDPVLFTARLAAAAARYRHKAIPGVRITGPIGGPLP
jgi:hypothetical protein